MRNFNPRELSPELHRRWMNIFPCACYSEWYGSARCVAHQRIIDEHFRTYEFVLMVKSHYLHSLRGTLPSSTLGQE